MIFKSLNLKQFDLAKICVFKHFFLEIWRYFLNELSTIGCAHADGVTMHETCVCGNIRKIYADIYINKHCLRIVVRMRMYIHDCGCDHIFFLQMTQNLNN